MLFVAGLMGLPLACSRNIDVKVTPAVDENAKACVFIREEIHSFDGLSVKARRWECVENGFCATVWTAGELHDVEPRCEQNVTLRPGAKGEDA